MWLCRPYENIKPCYEYRKIKQWKHKFEEPNKTRKSNKRSQDPIIKIIVIKILHHTDFEQIVIEIKSEEL